MRLQVAGWRAERNQQPAEVPSLDRRPVSRVAARALVPVRDRERLGTPVPTVCPALTSAVMFSAT
jgi:hypothetical protein